MGVACKDGMVWMWHVRMGWCECVYVGGIGG